MRSQSARFCWLAVVVLASASAACAHAKGAAPGGAVAPCPGSPPTGCLTTPECSYDESRQCNACRCGSPNPATPSIVNAEGIPPVR